MQYRVIDICRDEAARHNPGFERRSRHIVNEVLQRAVRNRLKLSSRNADRRRERIELALEQDRLDDVHPEIPYGRSGLGNSYSLANRDFEPRNSPLQPMALSALLSEAKQCCRRD